MNEEYDKEQANSARSVQKAKSEVDAALKIAQKGSYYWKELLAEAMKHNMLSFKEISLLKVAIEIETTGKIPSALQAKSILRLEKRLEDAGIIIR